MAGLDESEVIAVATGVAESHVPLCLYKPMAGLLAVLHGHGWQLAIVSASNRWVVEACATKMGFPQSVVIGVDCAVEAGRLTPSLIEPVPNGHGKVLALRKRGGEPPLLVAGNSCHDMEMLEMADEMALAVNPDATLYQAAVQRGWWVSSLK